MDPALGLGASSDPLTDFKGIVFCSASPSSQSAKLRNHLSERGPNTVGSPSKRVVTLRMSVCWGREPTCWSLPVVVAYPGSRMLGGHGVYVNKCLEHLVPPLPDRHVNGLLPKAKLSKDKKS